MNTSPRRVLVAGASGYLGGFVAREFKRRGHFVRALARSAERLKGMEEDLDEIVVGQVTKPETIREICDGMDVVFSSVGITKQKDGLTFQDVDYQGNRNLLEAAQRAGVGKFIYISVFRGPSLLHLAIVKAHEDFVTTLKASGMPYTVIRPTGFFSDMGEYLKMAEKGRVYLIGPGNNRINPIHGADLAEVCVDAAGPAFSAGHMDAAGSVDAAGSADAAARVDAIEEKDLREVDVGGPEVLTHREIALLALAAAGKPVRITSIPVWAMRAGVFLTRIVNRHEGELLAFFTEAMTTDAVAPQVGSRRLTEHFQELAAKAGMAAAHTSRLGERTGR